MLNGKSILITGGTGSLGKKLVQIILSRYRPAKLVVFSRDELKQFEMKQRFGREEYPCMQYLLGDVRDYRCLEMAFREVDYIFHTAALKQVPAAETNPEEFVKTNIHGAMNVIRAAVACHVKKVVALSTDKACNPINMYGATKLCSDKLFANACVHGGGVGTIYCVVRYGNVMGSRGSVVPFFKERARTGVLPITDPAMTRFWITLDQGAHFCLMALARSCGREIFVPKIPSTKITDLATAIDPGCEQAIVGIRPGEKIHELLISRDDARSTFEFDDHYVIYHARGSEKIPECYQDVARCAEGYEYNSGSNPWFLSVEELRKVLRDIEDDYAIEESRWSMTRVPQ